MNEGHFKDTLGGVFRGKFEGYSGGDIGSTPEPIGRYGRGFLRSGLGTLKVLWEYFGTILIA